MTKDELEKDLIRSGYLKSPLLIEAFREIDRRDFLPKNLGNLAYINEPLHIGFGQTISQPLTVAFMLELLSPKPGEKILDVGAGSGWQTALLAYAVSQKGISNSKFLISKHGNNGTIIAVERIPELAKMAEENIRKYNFLEKGIVKIVLGDGSQGASRELLPRGGFDKIIAAAAAEDIPQAWKEQLKTGGRIVAPVFQSIWVLDKMSEKEFSAEGGPASGWKKQEYFGFSFVPLVSDKK